MEKCEVCGIECTSGICYDCEYRINTGDNTDIWNRVAEHCNIEYKIVTEICKFYNCQDSNIFGENVNHAARRLYIFVMVRNIGKKQVEVGSYLNIPKSNISRIMAQMTTKFKSELARKKFENVLKIK